MTPSAPADSAPAQPAHAAQAIDPSKILSFPQGLHGFEHRHSYVLADLAAADGWFKLLQAVEEPSLGFVVLPITAASGLIEADDLDRAARHCRIQPQDALALAIVTVRKEAEGVALTANLRAPLLIDCAKRQGCQFIFQHERYDLRHRLPAEPPAAAAGGR
jgi:flagellar assembly factor FliW